MTKPTKIRSHRDQLLAFWRKCVEWSKDRPDLAKELLGSFASYPVVLDKLDDTSMPLLLAVAPYIDVGFDPYDFVDALLRFVEAEPEKVLKILQRALSSERQSSIMKGNSASYSQSWQTKAKGLKLLP